MPSQYITHAGLVLSALAHNKYYELVKVVNIAGDIIYLAASYLQTGMQSPDCKYLYLPSLDLMQRKSVADITRSPTYNQGLMGSITLDTTKQHFYPVFFSPKADL